MAFLVDSRPARTSGCADLTVISEKVGVLADPRCSIDVPGCRLVLRLPMTWAAREPVFAIIACFRCYRAHALFGLFRAR